MRQLILVLTLGLLASPALGQTVVFEEDFDAGIPATWTNIQLGYTGDIWEVGSGFVNGTSDVYHEGFCDSGSYFRDNILLSPPIDFTNVTTARLELDQFHTAAGSLFYNAIEVSIDDGATYQVLFKLNSPSNDFSTIRADMSAYAGVRSVRVALHYQGVISNNWSVDNIRITTPWADLANAIGGAGGDPLLLGTGPLNPGSNVVLALTNAPQAVSAHLVLGLSQLDAPFKGGVMVPQPDFLVSLITSDGDGSLTLESTWPPGVPSGTSIFFQYWIPDRTGPQGFLASNAVSGTTP